MIEFVLKRNMLYLFVFISSSLFLLPFDYIHPTTTKTTTGIRLLFHGVMGQQQEEEVEESKDNEQYYDNQEVNQEPPTTSMSTKFSDPPQKLLSRVVLLNDNNFEHLTQASTGQTTGSWLIYFYSKYTDKVPMSGTLPPKSVWDEEYYTTLAAMDISGTGPNTSIGTFKRFRMERTPIFLLIHKGKAYNIPLSFTSSTSSTSSTATTTTKDWYSWDDIVSFLQNPDPQFAYTVPPAPTLWSTMMEQIQKDQQTAIVVFVGCLLVMIFGTVIVSILLRESSAPTTKAAAAAAAAAAKNKIKKQKSS